jgi:hypothetical protein
MFQLWVTLVLNYKCWSSPSLNPLTLNPYMGRAARPLNQPNDPYRGTKRCVEVWRNFVHSYLKYCGVTVCCRNPESVHLCVARMYPLHLLNPSKNPDSYVAQFSQQVGWLESQLSLFMFCSEWTMGWIINTGLYNEPYLLTTQAVSGVLYPYNSGKTNAKESEISTKIDVYSYSMVHRHASCSVGVICRGCGVVPFNTQSSIY